MANVEDHHAYVRLTMMGEEHPFCLTLSQVMELEALYDSLYATFMSLLDRKEAPILFMERVIVAGLTGAGTDKDDAQSLADKQLRTRPLGEAWALCVAILSPVFFGNADYQAAADAANAIKAQTVG